MSCFHHSASRRLLTRVTLGPQQVPAPFVVGDAMNQAHLLLVRSPSRSFDGRDRTVGQVGSVAPRFRVLRPHGTGCGAVSVALDFELNRQVAIKEILDHHVHNLANRNRFLLEARSPVGSSGQAASSN